MSTKAKVSTRSKVVVNPTIVRAPQNPVFRSRFRAAEPFSTPTYVDLDGTTGNEDDVQVYPLSSLPMKRPRTESRIEDMTRERDEARDRIDALDVHFKERLLDEEHARFKRDMAELHCINEERDKLSDALAKGTPIALKDAIEAHLKVLQEMAQRHRTFPGGYEGAMNVLSGRSDGLGKRGRDDKIVFERTIDLRKKRKIL